MKLNIEYEPLPIWHDFYAGDWDEAVLIGSRGSGKTWNVSNFSCLGTLKDFNYRTLVLRDVGGSIKESIFKEIKDRFFDIQDEVENSSGKERVLESVFDFQATQITNKITKESNVFSKGFRTSRVGQTSDLKGFADIDLVIMEEMEDIQDEERVMKLIDTLRKKGHKIVIILNTPSLQHWVVKRYFDYELADTIDGIRYYNLVPKKIERVCQVVASYSDNPFLPDSVIQRYKSYGDVNSHNYNKHHYYQDILGLATFSGVNQSFFSQRKIEETFEKLKSINPVFVEEELKMYEKPNPQKVYFAGIDSADEGRDSYSLDIIDSTGKQVATLAGTFKQELDNGTKETGSTFNFTQKSIQLLKAYNTPFLAVETKSTGRTVQRDIVSAGYPIDKLWRDKNTFNAKSPETMKYGFNTNMSNRPMLLTDLQNVFNNGWLQVLDKETLKQFDTFIKIDGKWQAQAGKHDDRVISLGLAFQSYLFATS